MIKLIDLENEREQQCQFNMLINVLENNRPCRGHVELEKFNSKEFEQTKWKINQEF